MKLFLILLSFSSVSLADECSKEITVQEVFIRSNPNPFRKVQEPSKIGNTETIKIKCQLYKEISVGDMLKNPDEEISSFHLFSGDGGVLERKYYKVLKK